MGLKDECTNGNAINTTMGGLVAGSVAVGAGFTIGRLAVEGITKNPLIAIVAVGAAVAIYKMNKDNEVK